MRFYVDLSMFLAGRTMVAEYSFQAFRTQVGLPLTVDSQTGFVKVFFLSMVFHYTIIAEYHVFVNILTICCKS